MSRYNFIKCEDTQVKFMLKIFVKNSRRTQKVGVRIRIRKNHFGFTTFLWRSALTLIFCFPQFVCVRYLLNFQVSQYYTLQF
jgi:hypothetical protein